jgi:hypothetical protein
MSGQDETVRPSASDIEQSQTKSATLPPKDIRPRVALDERWIEAFYKECGREVTLAYTTLNQMKNWAMTVTAAAISGLAFGSNATSYPNRFMFVGVVVVYVFVLRFYIRAILCYINLCRWNRLQSDCVELKLTPRDITGRPTKNCVELEKQFLDDLQNYYFKWLSPIDRKTQILSNIKLGFGLLFALVLFFFSWGLLNLWQDRLVKALLFFCVGTTIVELNDFLKSSYFDTVEARASRKDLSRVYEIFPIPASRGWYLTSWVFVIILSVGVAEWPKLAKFVHCLAGHP